MEQEVIRIDGKVYEESKETYGDKSRDIVYTYETWVMKAEVIEELDKTFKGVDE